MFAIFEFQIEVFRFHEEFGEVCSIEERRTVLSMLLFDTSVFSCHCFSEFSIPSFVERNNNAATFDESVCGAVDRECAAHDVNKNFEHAQFDGAYAYNLK